MLSLSLPLRPLCIVGRPWRKKKRARGARRRRPPRSSYFFHHCYFYRNTLQSFCGGQRCWAQKYLCVSLNLLGTLSNDYGSGGSRKWFFPPGVKHASRELKIPRLRERGKRRLKSHLILISESLSQSYQLIYFSNLGEFFWSWSRAVTPGGKEMYKKGMWCKLGKIFQCFLVFYQPSVMDTTYWSASS